MPDSSMYARMAQGFDAVAVAGGGTCAMTGLGTGGAGTGGADAAGAEGASVETGGATGGSPGGGDAATGVLDASAGAGGRERVALKATTAIAAATTPAAK
jgi:hypothetical protein